MLAKDNIQTEMPHNTDNSNSENKVNVGKASGNTTNSAAFFVKVPESLEKANVEESNNSINKYQKDNTITTINTPPISSEPLLLCKAEHELSTLKSSSEGASQGISAFSAHSSISENGHADVRINDMIHSETSFTHEQRTNESNRSSPIAQSTHNIIKSDYTSSSHVPLHPLELEKNEEVSEKATTSVKDNNEETNINLRVTNVTRTHSGLATLLRINNNNNNNKLQEQQHDEKQKQEDENEKLKEVSNAAQMNKHVEVQNTNLLSSKTNTTTINTNNVNTEGNTYSFTTKPYTASTNNNMNNVSSNYTQRMPQSLYTVTANASLDEDCYPMLQIHSHHHNNNNNSNSNNNNTNNLSSSSCSSSNNSNSHSFHHDYSHQQKQQQPQKEKEKEMNEEHSSSANSNYENKFQNSLHNQPTEANTNIMNNNNNAEDNASYPYCIIENTNENSHINDNTMNNNSFMEEGNLSNNNNNPNPENNNNDNNNGPAMSCVPTVRAEELLDLLDQHQRSQINHNNISNDNSNSSNSNGVCCPPGWFFSVYDADISQHYSIPSEQVEITRGAIKYLMLYEKFGQQTRFRFQLCKRFLHQRCGSGAECHYIHSQMVPTSTWVHINENCVTALNTHTLSEEELRGGKNKLKYITMPSGILFKIYPPNQSNAPPQLIPSDKILYTMGATNVYRVLVRHNHEQQQQQHNNNSNITVNNNNLASEVAKLKPRHCAHFQFKRMCNLGTSCNFIHSLVPFIQGVVNQPPIPPELMWQVEQQQSNKMSHRNNNNNMNMNMNQNNYNNGYPSGNNNTNGLTIRVGAPSVNNNLNNFNNYSNNRMEVNSMQSMLPSSTPSQQYNIFVPSQMYNNNNNNNNQMMNEANYYQYAQQQQQQQQFTPNQYVVNNLNNNNNDYNNAQMYQRNEYSRINNNNNNNVMSVNGPVQTSVSNYPLQQIQQIQRQEVQEGQQQPFHYEVENNNNNNSMATMMMMQMKMKSMPMTGNYNTVNNGYNEQQQGQVQRNGNVYLNAPNNNNYNNYNYNENNNFQADVNETRRSLQQQQPANVSLYSYSSLSPAQNIIHESDNNSMNTNQINSQVQRMPHLIQHTQMVQENINNNNSQNIINNNNENNNGNYENTHNTPAQRYTAYSSIVNEVRPEIQNYTSTINNNNMNNYMNDVSFLNEMNMPRQNRSATTTTATNTNSPSQPSYSLHSEPEMYKMNRINNNNIYPAYQTDNMINNVNMNEGNANTFSRQSAQSMSSDYRRNENNNYSQANSTSYITNSTNNNGEMFISPYANSEQAISTMQQPQSMTNAHLYHDANLIMNERQINAHESNMEKLAYMQSSEYSQQQQNQNPNQMENQRPQSYSAATRHANYTMTNANNYNTVQYAS